MSQLISIINGPNLNLLGTREPDIYGSETLSDIEAKCRTKASALGYEIGWFQSNIEGELIDQIQHAKDAGGVIINAGAYTHTSIGILDALKTLTCPIIEVHCSNIYARESFRHHSYISAAATGLICGFGGHGYELALEAVVQKLSFSASRD